jgi:lactoylglutathione lyase
MKKNLLSILLVQLFLFTFCCKAYCQKTRPAINHLAIYVYNLKKSVAFYRNIIQLDTMPNPFNDGKHIFFKLGNRSQLHIIDGAPHVTVHNKYDHLAFKVSSVEKFVAHLNKQGIDYEDWSGKHKLTGRRADGVKQIYFQDPDGYWIEINDDKY